MGLHLGSSSSTRADAGCFCVEGARAAAFAGRGWASNSTMSCREDSETSRSRASNSRYLYKLDYKEVVHPSGHSTLRVAVYNHDEVPKVRETFKQLGCSTEQSHLRGLIAIDVPPSISWDELKQVLDTGREQDRWDYQEACLARS